MSEYRFYWKGINAQGQEVDGFLRSSSRAVAIAALLQDNIIPLRLARQTSKLKRQAATQNIYLFRQLATLLHAGLTLSESLLLIADSEIHPEWRALLHDLQHQIAQGLPFSGALTRWPDIFPPLYAALIGIGEITGNLDVCCQRLAQQQEHHQCLQNNVRRAMRYPAFTLIIALLVSIGMLTWVLPEFDAIYKSFNAPLPFFTRQVISLSDYLRHDGLLSVTIASSAWYGVRIAYRRNVVWQRFAQRWLLKIPLSGKLTCFNQLSTIFSTLALTQQAGLTLPDSLRATANVISQHLWKDAVQSLHAHIVNGNPLNTLLLQHALFPPLCHQMIKAGETSGTLDTIMSKLAEIYYREAQQRADNLTAALEPVMMLLVAIIVGTLVIAMYLPLFNLGDVLG